MWTKVSELTGTALDWAVDGIEHNMRFEDYDAFCMRSADESYVANWAKGGPIIEREGISWHCGNKSSWHAYGYGSAENYNGQTPLIAAMRCYVASKLGDEIEIPEELA